MADHTITIHLSDAAQRAALVSGLPAPCAAAVQTYAVPTALLPALLELPWTKVGADGTATCVVPTRIHYSQGAAEAPPGSPFDARAELGYSWNYGGVDGHASTRPPDPAAAIEFARAKLEAYAAALEASRVAHAARRASIAADNAAKAAQDAARLERMEPVLAAWEQDHLAARAAGVMGRDEIPGFEGGHGDGSYVPEPLRSRLYALRLLLAEQDAEAERAQEARKAAQLAACVERWGDESQRARLAEGLLPDEEAKALIRDHVLAPLAACPPYQRITASDIDHDEDCCDHRIDCERSDAGELTAEEYARLVEIRVGAREAEAIVGGTHTITLREHTCTCCGCDEAATRRGALVRVAWGELAVSREYAL